MCVQGASWVRQEVLRKYDDADLKIYVVWLSMVPGDEKSKWNPTILADDRAQQFWDEDRVVGKWLAQNMKDCEHLGPIDWDSFYLFDSDAKWEDTLEPVVSCGTPVIRTAKKLAEGLEKLLED